MTMTTDTAEADAGQETAESVRRGRPPAGQDPAKRKQIIDGARRVFIELGFDAASMNDITRAAGVSKGTLYVYFDSKEALFEAIVEEESASQAERVFALDSNDHDVEAVLVRLGRSFVKFLSRPGGMSPLRTVISISERMPDIGRQFYETGPMKAINKLSHYLAAEVAAGNLVIEDCEVAAAQFLDSCSSTVFKPLLFNAAEAPSEDRINHVVAIAVRTFLSAYQRPT